MSDAETTQRAPLLRRMSSRVKFGFTDPTVLDNAKQKVKDQKVKDGKLLKHEWLDVPTYPIQDLDWLLAYRTIVMVLFQALVGTFAGAAFPEFDDGTRAKWWPLNVLVANAWTLAALSYALHGERDGRTPEKTVVSLWALPKPHKWLKLATKPRNIVWLALMASVLYVTTGNRWWPEILQSWFGGISLVTFSKLPQTVIAICGVLVPISTALADFPTYYGFVLPRLMKHYPRKEDWWRPILVVAVWHAIQHISAPFQWSLPYMVYRFLAFFPMTVVVALCLSRQPRLMPFAMAMQAISYVSLMLEMSRRS